MSFFEDEDKLMRHIYSQNGLSLDRVQLAFRNKDFSYLTSVKPQLEAIDARRQLLEGAHRKGFTVTRTLRLLVDARARKTK